MFIVILVNPLVSSVGALLSLVYRSSAMLSWALNSFFECLERISRVKSSSTPFSVAQETLCSLSAHNLGSSISFASCSSVGVRSQLGIVNTVVLSITSPFRLGISSCCVSFLPLPEHASKLPEVKFTTSSYLDVFELSFMAL